MQGAPICDSLIRFCPICSRKLDVTGRIPGELACTTCVMVWTIVSGSEESELFICGARAH